MTPRNRPPFDTSALAAQLRRGGWDAEQADAVVEALRSTLTPVRNDMDDFKSEIREAINAQTWRIIGVVVALYGITIAIILRLQ